MYYYEVHTKLHALHWLKFLKKPPVGNFDLLILKTIEVYWLNPWPLMRALCPRPFC
jgi:hypothetical protein